MCVTYLTRPTHWSKSNGLNGWMDRLVDRQMDRLTGRQTDKQIHDSTASGYLRRQRSTWIVLNLYVCWMGLNFSRTMSKTTKQCSCDLEWCIPGDPGGLFSAQLIFFTPVLESTICMPGTQLITCSKATPPSYTYTSWATSALKHAGKLEKIADQELVIST